MTLRRLFEEAGRLLREAGVEEPRLEPARNPEFGEAASLAAFELARKLKRSPREIAAEFVRKIRPREGGLVEKVEAVGGYINFKVDWRRYASEIVSAVLREGGSYGASGLGGGKRVLVEHTSVNPNKALHVGHARNLCLGDTLARMLKFIGYDTIVLNYVDDSGAQMADVILGFSELGYSLKPPNEMRFDEYCGDVVYVEAARKVEEDAELEDKRKLIAKEIESRKGGYYELNKLVVEKVLKEQLKTCWRLGAKYDILNMESDVLAYDLWGEVFEKLKERGAVYLAESGAKAGCWLLDLSGHPLLSKEGDEVLVKSDGATTYVARDIAYAAWKLGGTSKDFTYRVWGRNPDGSEILVTDLGGDVQRPLGEVELSVNVIDARQRRPQEVVKHALRLLGLEADKYIHYAYEVVALSTRDAVKLGYRPEGGEQMVHMSGRKGLYLKADQMLDMLKERAAGETRKRHPDWSDERVWEVAEKIAVGALRYALVKPDPDKLIVLDTSEMLRLEGNTGPYLQYTYARACRILEKSEGRSSSEAPGELSEEEKRVLRKIASFPLVVEEAGRMLLPKNIANYAYDLASEFNNFYEHIPVLQAPKKVREFRLGIVESFKTTLANAMRLLGVPVLEEM